MERPSVIQLTCCCNTCKSFFFVRRRWMDNPGNPPFAESRRCSPYLDSITEDVAEDPLKRVRALCSIRQCPNQTCQPAACVNESPRQCIESVHLSSLSVTCMMHGKGDYSPPGGNGLYILPGFAASRLNVFALYVCDEAVGAAIHFAEQLEVQGPACRPR